MSYNFPNFSSNEEVYSFLCNIHHFSKEHYLECGDCVSIELCLFHKILLEFLNGVSSKLGNREEDKSNELLKEVIVFLTGLLNFSNKLFAERKCILRANEGDKDYENE